MDLQVNTDLFNRLQRLTQRTFLQRMVSEAGVIAVNFSKDRFRFKNWIDKTAEKWQARKRPDRGSLLLRTGRLKRSIRKIASGDYYVVVGTDVPYAQLHNEGGSVNKVAQVKAHTRKVVIRQRRVNRRGNVISRAIGSRIVNVRAHNRKMNLTMPKRQFLGESELLMRRIEMHVNREFNKELQ
ncbi:phage virion morphogenesis protein [Capnocytophaga leadbetteri]|uniref:phage virion morphogenesis protein n=1 Tax=Capnocytophaga leadbetteri TaxID=327575 RepID=UPI0028E96D82|nr:phage virion morphogenesis protein [Capnocytophaga leadbetteri]